MEAYVCGVSTRSVDDLVAALGIDSGISKSEVSRICAGLDEVVTAFRTRRLDHIEFPYVYLDATYLHVRNAASQVVSMAVVVASGVRADGDREILGLDVGDSEDEVFWRGFLTNLKKRGLGGVRLVVSDQHAGLVAALTRSFQGAAHQRFGCTSPATCSHTCPSPTPTWPPRCSAPCSPSPTQPPWPRPGTRSAISWPAGSPRSGH
jgi:putative transposase